MARIRFILVLMMVAAALSSPATFPKKINIAQVIVSGITQLVAGLDSVSMNSNDDREKRAYIKPYLTPEEIKQGIRNDFLNGYLFSGAIDSELYDESCVFTDPTLSFKGLTRFENNIKSIKPLIDLLLDDTLVVLYDLDQKMYNDDNNVERYSVNAQWRMSGGVRLPWKPRIELTGRTRYTLNSNCDNRIVDYYELWDLEATTVIGQLLWPSNKRRDYEDIETVKEELLLVSKQPRSVSTDSRMQQAVDKLISRIEIDKNDGEFIGLHFKQKSVTISIFRKDVNFFVDGIAGTNEDSSPPIYEEKSLRIFKNDKSNCIFVLKELD